MKVIEITKGKRELEQLIIAFERSHSFADYLVAIEYCLKEAPEKCENLDVIWARNKNLILCTDSLSGFAAFLQMIRIIYEPREPTEITSDASDLCKQIFEISNKQESEFTKYKASYSWFHPALVIRQLLEELYPAELNPGRKIGECLDILFPAKKHECKTSLFADFYAEVKYNITFNSNIHKLLMDIAEWVIKSNDLSISYCKCLEICFHEILDPHGLVEFKRGLTFDNFLILLLHAPRELLYLWLYRVIINHENHINGRRCLTVDEALSILKIMPIGRGSIPYVIQNKVLDNTYNSLLESHFHNLEHISFNKFLSIDSVLLILDILHETDLDSLYRLNEEGIGILKFIMDVIYKFRHEYFSGSSPFDDDLGSMVSSLFEDTIGIENTDFSMILSTGMYDGGALWLIPYAKTQTYQEQMDFFNHKQANYIILFNKAVDDGQPELGTALISLYMLQRSFFTEGRFGKLPELNRVIEKALKLPGAKMLRHTLGIICDSISKYFTNDNISRASLHYLQKYVEKDTKLYILQGGKIGLEPHYSEPDIVAILTRELGIERWEKLSKQSRQLIVSAEMMWKNCAVEFGFGIKDWSGIITPYCKALEYELVERMNKFYYSDEYLHYLGAKGKNRAAHPTACGLLVVLKEFKYLPKRLQNKLVDSQINLYENQQLIFRLIDLMTNFRNKAAHKDIVGMKNYTEFREKLLHEKTLHLFIDSLC